MEPNFEYALQRDQLQEAVDTIRELGLAAPSVDALYNSTFDGYSSSNTV